MQQLLHCTISGWITGSTYRSVNVRACANIAMRLLIRRTNFSSEARRAFSTSSFWVRSISYTHTLLLTIKWCHITWTWPFLTHAHQAKPSESIFNLSNWNKCGESSIDKRLANLTPNKLVLFPLHSAMRTFWWVLQGISVWIEPFQISAHLTTTRVVRADSQIFVFIGHSY